MENQGTFLSSMLFVLAFALDGCIGESERYFSAPSTSPACVDLGDFPVGQSAGAALTLKNNRDVELLVFALPLSGEGCEAFRVSYRGTTVPSPHRATRTGRPQDPHHTDATYYVSTGTTSPAVRGRALNE